MRVDTNTPERTKYEQKYNKFLLERWQTDKLEAEYF